MQKRAKKLEIRFVQVDLPPELPVSGGELHEQQDQPITYLHWHPCLEIGYCYAGSGIFMIGEKVLSFNAGDVSFINHTEVHLAQSAPGTSSQWTWIYLDPIRLVAHPGLDARQLDTLPLAGVNFNNLLPAQEHPQINRVVQRITEELRERKKGSGSAMRALVWELMTLMHRLMPSRKGGEALSRQHYDRIAPALQFMSSNYRQAVNIGVLAQCCHLSEPQFRRLFIQAINCPPREYWHALRLRMAASLLKTTSRSILEISQDVGYESLSSFNRQFLEFHKDSPRNWRNSHKILFNQD